MAHSYLPAAGHDWLLPIYDPLVKLGGVGQAREAVLARANIRPGHRVLDIGCGTGTFAILARSQNPAAEVTGIDPDPKALAKAGAKAARAGVSVRFDQAYADRLPYPDGSFDRIFSTLMFHHLPPDSKQPVLREVRRVLAAGGSFYLLDFVPPDQPRFAWARFLRSSRRVRDNESARILDLLEKAGFSTSQLVSRGSLFFGILPTAVYEATVASAARP